MKVPVPDQLPAYHQSLALIALQRTEHWRNLAHDKRHPNIRRSKLIQVSYYDALVANQKPTGLFEIGCRANLMAKVIVAVCSRSTGSTARCSMLSCSPISGS